MLKWFGLGVLACSVMGCSGLSPRASSWPQHAAVPVGEYDFNWRLSGDPSVAPLQVFSGMGKIWLQFPVGHALPALFGKTTAGMQPLPYQVLGPYVVIDGDWDTIVFRGGHLVATAERQAAQGHDARQSLT
jgi:hypothetical protein